MPTKIRMSGQKSSILRYVRKSIAVPNMMMKSPTSMPPQWWGSPKHISSSRRVLPLSTPMTGFPHCEHIAASSGFFAPHLTQ